MRLIRRYPYTIASALLTVGVAALLAVRGHGNSRWLDPLLWLVMIGCAFWGAIQQKRGRP